MNLRMKAKQGASIGMSVAAAYLTGCTSVHQKSARLATVNAGITITSSPLQGGPYANGQIKVVTDDPDFGTEWCPYRSVPPSNPIWRSTVTGPGNPGSFAPGKRFVMLQANQPVNYPSNPVCVNVVAGRRTKVVISY